MSGEEAAFTDEELDAMLAAAVEYSPDEKLPTAAGKRRTLVDVVCFKAACLTFRGLSSSHLTARVRLMARIGDRFWKEQSMKWEGAVLNLSPLHAYFREKYFGRRDPGRFVRAFRPATTFYFEVEWTVRGSIDPEIPVDFLQGLVMFFYIPRFYRNLLILQDASKE